MHDSRVIKTRARAPFVNLTAAPRHNQTKNSKLSFVYARVSYILY